ncbi:MAG: dTDP-4-dehydrorhamnose reductase [Casimicrobiaceae bacterium]
MKLLITGAGGQLGRALARRLAQRHEIAALDRQELDLTDGRAIAQALATHRPEVVLNCAAYTAVDRAEREREAAFAVNAAAPAWLGQAAAERGIILIHFSTDYVFDGELGRAEQRGYREDDPTGPLGVYGESKLAGERAVLAHPGHGVLRLAWVYGNEGANFMKTMLRLAAERNHLRVVADQWGVPNYTGDLADAVARMLDRPREALRMRLQEAGGLYHLSALGPTTWHGFASEIVRRGGFASRVVVEAITTADYPTPARRPAWSVLDPARFAAAFDWQPPAWQAGLARCFAERSQAA